jgi:hypothetical protein
MILRLKIYKLQSMDIKTATSSILLSTLSFGTEKLLIEPTLMLISQQIAWLDSIAIARSMGHTGCGGRVHLRFTQTTPHDNLAAAHWIVM